MEKGNYIKIRCSLAATMYDNEDYKKSNRETRLSPKSHSLHWCDCCDRNKIHSGEMCRVCGHRDSVKRLKKDT